MSSCLGCCFAGRPPFHLFLPGILERLPGRFLIFIKGSRVSPRLKFQTVNYLCGILRIAGMLEAQLMGQGLQVAIGCGIY